MNLFTSHEPRHFAFTNDVEQTVLGWCQGGCDIVWSDHLPALLAEHGAAMCGGKTVLELGAGCGLVGLVAAHWATRVDITDGDEEEVELIRMNCAEHAPAEPEQATLEAASRAQQG